MAEQSNKLAERIGPFYDTNGLVAWLGVSAQEIQARREARTILGCLTAEGEFIYPTWQFQDDGELLPGLHEILEVLAGGIEDGWTWGLWLKTAVPGELDGQPAVEWVRDGGDVQPVLQLAASDAALWAA